MSNQRIMYLMGFLMPYQEEYDPASLHITIMPKFSIPDVHLDSFIEELGGLIGSLNGLPFETGDSDYFERLGEPVPVVFVDDKWHDFKHLHNSVQELASRYGAEFLDPYIGERYRPHISYYEGEGVNSVREMVLVSHEGVVGNNVTAMFRHEF